MSPEAVFTAAHEALRRRDAEALIALVEPESLEEWSRELRQHDLTEVFEADRAVKRVERHGIPAEALQSYMEYLAGLGERVRRDYGVSSQAELERLTPLQLLRGALLGIHESVWTEFRCVPLGHVVEGGDTAHLLFRQVTDNELDQRSAPLQVATLRRVGPDWRLCLEGGNEAGVPGIPTACWGWVPGWPDRVDEPAS